jgi:hypothetical protein
MSTIVTWFALFGLYLLFAGEVSRNELACAVVVATAGSVWTYSVRSGARRRFAAVWNAGWVIVRTLARLAPATVSTGGALFEAAWSGASPGRSRSFAFEHGAEDDPQEGMRRANAVLCASLAPDRFVVNLARGEDALFHDLGSAGSEPDERWLQ